MPLRGDSLYLQELSVLWLHLLPLGQLEFRAASVSPGTPRVGGYTMQGGGGLEVAGLGHLRISVTPPLLTDHVTHQPQFKPSFETQFKTHLYDTRVGWRILQVLVAPHGISVAS